MPGLCALQYIFIMSNSYMHGVNLSPEMVVSFIAYHNILSHPLLVSSMFMFSGCEN